MIPTVTLLPFPIYDMLRVFSNYHDLLECWRRPYTTYMLLYRCLQTL